MDYPKTETNNKSGTLMQYRSIVALLFFTLLCALPLFFISLSEDITAMLPQGQNGRIAEDFKLLQKAPLSGNVLISISGTDTTPVKLSAIADSLAAKMTPPYMIMQDYSSITPQAVIGYLLKTSPRLSTGNDLEKLKSLTSATAIKTTLQSSKRQLLSPAGFGMKGIIIADPLNLRSIYLEKIRSLTNLPRFKVQGRHFFNKDKSAVLLVAKSEIPMTDSRRGELLLKHFNAIKQEALSENGADDSTVNISLLSGHLYTCANASIIKRDIFTVSAISVCALTLLFFCSFRRAGALSIFLAPGVAIIAGLGTSALFFPNLSAIVIGFGAVLMGISIDFAVHTYFALAETPENKKKALRKITAPVLFGAATSCASFAALYVSGIPGIRQLALFSVAGIIAACGYALIFIPRFCTNFPEISLKEPSPKNRTRYKKTALFAAMIILLSGTVAAFSNSFDTELKKLGYIPTEIIRAEKHFQEKWGNLRGQALLFAQGKTQEEALRNNEKIWTDITTGLPQTKAVSLAPLLPSKKSQKESSRRWTKFWSAQRIDKVASDLNKEALKQGFAPEKFIKNIRKLQETGPLITPVTMEAGPLGFLKELLIPPAGQGKYLIMTLLPDNKEMVRYFTPTKERQLGARLISQAKFKATLEAEMKDDIIRFISFSGILVLALILILFRNLRRAVLALFPAVFGVAATFGLLGLLQIPLNIFHIVALPLVIGLGADYGIFMVFQEIKSPSQSTVKAVKISGLTTLAGFGVLVFAKHPSLNSLGSTVAAGVSAALICAVFILPHMLRLNNTKADAHE